MFHLKSDFNRFRGFWGEDVFESVNGRRPDMDNRPLDYYKFTLEPSAQVS